MAESLSNELISWLNCSCLLLVNLKHFKFQCSILSQIFLILPVTQPFVCLFVKIGWLKFTSTSPVFFVSNPTWSRIPKEVVELKLQVNALQRAKEVAKTRWLVMG